MAETSETGQSQQPGAIDVANDCDKNKENELEELKKLLAAKDAEIAALKAQNVQSNDVLDSECTTDQGDEMKETKRPPKLDVTLSIRGTPEYDSYPYALASDKFYYMASIKAPYFREDVRAPIDLVAVVDESGSMSGARIKLVRETVKFIIRNLEHRDRFGIIGYSTGSRKLLPLTLMDAAGKRKAEAAASSLRAQGATALCKGLVDGVNMMRERTSKNQIASVMILTDGQANQGPTEASKIKDCVLAGEVISDEPKYPDFLSNINQYDYYNGPSNINNYMFPMNRQPQVPMLLPMNAQPNWGFPGIPIQGQNPMNQLYNPVYQQQQGQQPLYQQQGQPLYQQQGQPIYQQQGIPQMPVNSNPFVSQGYPQAVPQGAVSTQNASAPLQRQVQNQGKLKKAQSNIIVGHPPAPGPAPVLQQQQGNPVTPSKKPNDKVNKMEAVMEGDDDDSKDPEEGGDSEEGSDELPCTINTFGFGANHNAELMKALADTGRGMYAYIENTEEIASSFAECLGGLVSVVGQNLKVHVQALNNVKIKRCLVKGFPVKVDIPQKKHIISVKDMQSEESRDFVFELSVPQIETEKKEDPLIQLSVQYDNVVKGTHEVLTNICNITRIDGKQIGERNVELDEQYNRVMAADAMEKADKLAKNGNLDGARNVLSTAETLIQHSASSSKMFSANLVKDMGAIRGNLMSPQLYQMNGSKQLVQQYQCQQQQRSYNCMQSPSLNCYSSSSKGNMRAQSQRL